MSWEHVFRVGIAPQLPTAGLEALATALREDSPELIQGATISPPNLSGMQDFPPVAACAIGFCGWQGSERNTVGDVEEFFGNVCFAADQILGEPSAVRFFLNVYDNWTRDEMRAVLLPVVEDVLEKRKAVKS